MNGQDTLTDLAGIREALARLAAVVCPDRAGRQTRPAADQAQQLYDLLVERYAMPAPDGVA